MADPRAVDRYLRLPWTIVSSRSVHGPYTVLRIQELPEFVVTGTPGAELDARFWDALKGLIESYLNEGDAIPLPPNLGRWNTAESPAIAAAPLAYPDKPAAERAVSAGRSTSAAPAELLRTDDSLLTV